jgi:hypothetical protein
MAKAEGDSSDTSKQSNLFRFESWTSNDIKLLVITIVATTAANIITVVLVGVAIIIARSHHSLRTPRDYAWFFVGSILAAMICGVCIWGWRQSGTSKADPLKIRAISWGIRVFTAWFGLIFLLYILSWIGFAAGIK